VRDGPQATQAVIDYELTNTETSPVLWDARIYGGSVDSSHYFLFISKLIVPARWKKSSKKENISKHTFYYIYKDKFM
jgi:hypothetical protein